MKKIGLIPAAGKGSRLGSPFSKELYPIPLHDEYYPIILSNLLALKMIDVIEIVIIINSEKSDIMKFLGNGSKWGLVLNYVVQETSISLPNALAQAQSIIDGKEVFFLMADTIIEDNDFLVKFMSLMLDSFEISLGCFSTDTPGKFATVTIENGIVSFCEEKNPDSKSRTMWGFWRWKPSFTNKLVMATESYSKNVKEQTMSEIIENEINSGLVQGVFLEGYKYWDFGTQEEINRYIREHE